MVIRRISIEKLELKAGRRIGVNTMYYELTLGYFVFQTSKWFEFYEYSSNIQMVNLLALQRKKLN